MPCKKRSGLMNDRRAYTYNINVITPPPCPIIVDIDISTVNFSQNFTILACQRLTITMDKTIPLGVTFINYGTINYSGSGTLSVNGTFINYGTFNNTGNELYIGNNFINNGIFNNGSTATVNMGAIANAATFKNTGVFNNLGGVYLLITATYISIFYNYSGGRFNNSNTLTINSPEIFNNANGAGVCGSGTITNTGTIIGTIGTACPP